MDAFTGYENIMSALGIGTQKKFECWYDRYLKGRENMNMNMDGFSWDNAQIDFNYEFAEVTDNVTAMATYVDIYSQAVARGREIPIRKLAGYIPRQKRYETRDENDYRADMVEIQRISGAAQLMGESPYASIGDYLSKNLLDFAGDFPGSHAQSITYQVGQMKSNFMLKLTDENNPNGIVNVEFRANTPADNTHMGNYYTVDSGICRCYHLTHHEAVELLGTVRDCENRQLRFPVLSLGTRIIVVVHDTAPPEHLGIDIGSVGTNGCHVLDCTDVAYGTEQHNVLVKRFQERVLELLGSRVELGNRYNLIVELHVGNLWEETLEVAHHYGRVCSLYEIHIRTGFEGACVSVRL